MRPIHARSGFAHAVVLCAAAIVPSSSLSAGATYATGDPALEMQAAAALRVARCSVHAVAAPASPAASETIVIDLDGQPAALLLWRSSVFAPDFQLLEQRADGSIIERPAPPVCTYRGEVVGRPGARVAASIVNARLTALVRLADGAIHAVQPLDDLVPNVDPSLHASYRAADLIAGDERCGVDGLPLGDLDPAPVFGEGPAPEGFFWSARIALDADREFYVANGSSVPNTTNDLQTIINNVRLIYEAQADITYVIGQIIIRTAEPDPYSSTSPGTILSQTQTEWNTVQYFYPRDVTHLMTGKDLDGNVIGIAYLGTVCSSPTAAYGVSQSRYTTNMTQRTALTAHELGHGWNAAHCDGTPDCGIMCSALGGCTGNLTNFGAQAQGQIIAWRNGHTCNAPTMSPPHNACSQPLPVGTGTFAFQTINATTDGPGEGSCAFGGNNQINNDVWYDHTASCAGLTTISLCGANFDARMAVYAACPGGPGTPIACADNVCGNAPSITFESLAGAHCRVRIGGATSATGGGNMVITCQPAPANNSCPNATVVDMGSNPFTTVNATTDGPAESGACATGGFTQIANDVWFKWLSLCSGPVTVGACGSSFDAKLAIYFGCPTAGGQLLACSDNSCGTSPQVTFNSVPYTLYRIRIGAANNSATGTGTIVITCANLPCPADIAPPGGNDVVNIDDLLAVVNGWGNCPQPCPPVPTCPGNANGNCVVNIDDLLAVINAWGACP